MDPIGVSACGAPVLVPKSIHRGALVIPGDKVRALCQPFNAPLNISYRPSPEMFFNCHATHENLNLLEFEQKKNCYLILTLTWPFFIGF